MVYLGLRQFFCDLASLLYPSWQIQILRGQKRSRLPYIFQTDNNLSVFKSESATFQCVKLEFSGTSAQGLCLGLRSRFVVGLLPVLQCLNAVVPGFLPKHACALALPPVPDSSQ